MSRRKGENVAGFQQTQLDFAAYLRNPQDNPKPEGIEDRRLKIYRELFYNNIESLLASAFPVCKSVLGAAEWGRLMRLYLCEHAAQSPYFLEVSQELLEYLADSAFGPPFLLELAHYEWIELALDISNAPTPPADPAGDLMAGTPLLNPNVAALSYHWPVSEIGPDNQPHAPSDTPTLLIVFRDASDKVRFLKSSPATHRLLELLPGADSGQALVDALVSELVTMRPAQVEQQVRQTLQRLRDDSIIIGTALS